MKARRTLRGRKKRVTRCVLYAAFPCLVLLQLSIVLDLHSRLQHNGKTRQVVEPIIQDFAAGELDVRPWSQHQCASIRFRGDDNVYQVGEAVRLIRSKYRQVPGRRSLRIGLTFAEDPLRFFPVRIQNRAYHMYHFLEMLVISYSQLQEIANALDDVITVQSNDFQPTLAQGSVSVSVPWILSPYMSKTETCGGTSKINCFLAHLVLSPSVASKFQDGSGIYGLDAMENFTFTNEKEKEIDRRLHLAKQLYGKSHHVSKQADAVLQIERTPCNFHSINQIWSSYIERFPSRRWHTDVKRGLGLASHANKPLREAFAVCYIDRQVTSRHLPDEHHRWILDYFHSHNRVQFLHLHMENHTASEQVEIAAGCQMLVGVHGNGLSHLLWMAERSWVIEIFWMYRFQYDYATAAQLMKHEYLGLMNGQPLDSVLVANRDPILRSNVEAMKHPDKAKANRLFDTEGKKAIQAFVENAIRQPKPKL